MTSPTNATGATDPLDPTIHPAIPDEDVVGIIRNASPGDRIHMNFPTANEMTGWESAWVVETTPDSLITGTGYKLTVPSYASESETLPATDIEVFEDISGDWVSEEWTPNLHAIERIERETIAGKIWYKWEVRVSSIRGGGSPSDVVVFPEAPTREIAEAKAKRWAGMEYGFTPVVYEESRLIPPEEDSR